MSRPVLYIPGFPGSQLFIRDGKKIFLKLSAFLPTPDEEILDLLEGPDNLAADDGVGAGPPIEHLTDFLLFDLAKQAGTLYDILAKLDIEPSLSMVATGQPPSDRLLGCEAAMSPPITCRSAITAAQEDTSTRASGAIPVEEISFTTCWAKQI